MERTQTTSTKKLRVDASLDVRGLERSESYRKAVAQLSQMQEHDVLELHLDEGDALNTIPYGLRAEGHEILVSEPASRGVRLLIKKRTLIT